jgi:hypothetical protein
MNTFNTRFSPISPIAIVAVAAGLAPTLASAQVADVAPYYAVITSPKTPMHCGDSTRYYRVGELESGTIVVVDGTGQAWARVSYPSNGTAFVRAEEVTIAGTEATLTTASKLKAAHPVAGFNGSWSSLLKNPIASGRTFKVLEAVKDESGPIIGYRIAAPAESRGFVEARLLRKATDAEVQAFQAKGNTLPPLNGAAPAAASTPAVAPVATATPESKPATKLDAPTDVKTEVKTDVKPVNPELLAPVVVTPAESKPAEVKTPETKAPETKPVDLTQPQIPVTDLSKPTTTPTPKTADTTAENKAPEAKPTNTTPANTTGLPEGITVTDKIPVVAPNQPAPTTVETKETVKTVTDLNTGEITGTSTVTTQTTDSNGNTSTETHTTDISQPALTPSASESTNALNLEQLELTFRNVWKQPSATAEYEQLITEYNRAIVAEPNDARKKALQQRVDAINMRLDHRNKVRQLEESRNTIRSDRSVETTLNAYTQGRVYTMVGTLQPSTVYDGQRLPSMYRIVSVGGVAPRTLGYIKEKPEFKLVEKLGLVVGVVGEATMDRSLQLNVITPVVVDVLRSDLNNSTVVPPSTNK